MTDSVFPPTIDTFAQPIATTTVGPAPAGMDHAGLDRKVGQAIAALEARSQSSEFDYLVIQDSATYATGTKARNMRTSEQEFGPGAFHTVFDQVTAAIGAKAKPGGRVLLVSRKADNASIFTRDELHGCDGLHLSGYGYGKRGQTSTGHLDTSVVLEAENNQFPAGRKSVLDMTTGTGPLDSWILDGVSIFAHNESEVAVRAAATAQGMSSIFRANIRGGTAEPLRLGEDGWTGCGLVQIFHTQVSHSGTAAEALVTHYAGDLISAYNNIAIPGTNGYAYLIDTDGYAEIFQNHEGGGNSVVPGIKVVRTPHIIMSSLYHDNQQDHVNGTFWLKPKAVDAIRFVDILHVRINANDDGVGTPPLVVLDGSSAGRGIALVVVHGMFTKGNKLTGGTPALVPCVVRAVNGFDPESVVKIEGCDVMQSTKIWETDGSTAWVPAWTHGHHVSQTQNASGQVLSDQFLGPKTFSGVSTTLAHKLYGTPEYVRVFPIGSTPPAGRLSADATSTAITVHSTASETNLKVAAFVKMLGG